MRKTAEKAKVQKSFRRGPHATRLSEEEIVDAAIGAIRKGGPMTLSAITKAIKKAYPQVKGGVGKAVRAESQKTGARLARDNKGIWQE